MTTWMLADLPVIPWCGDHDELTEQAIEQMASWSFWWSDQRNLVMLTGEDDETSSRG